MKNPILLIASVAALMLANTSSQAAVKYWDINGTTTGSGQTTAGVTWDTTGSKWDLTAAGTGAATTFTAGDIAVFCAGTDSTGNYTITGNGTAFGGVTNLTGGIITLAGTQFPLNAGTWTVGNGITLAYASSSAFPVVGNVGSKFVLDGGHLRNTTAGNAGNFLGSSTAGANTTVTLMGNGGTFEVTGAVLSILNAANVVSGTGGLTKAGAGVLGVVAGPHTYTGGTTVTAGELRLRTSNNGVPTGQLLTVTSPGVFNLNGLSQSVGSITGTGNIGTAAGTLTVNGSTSTTFNGAVKDTANVGVGASGGTGGSLTKSGSGTITFAGLNDITGTFTLSAGGIVVNSGAALCAATCNLTVNGGTLTLSNAAQTVKNLSGSSGSIVLATGHTLTSVAAASATYSGVISGAGAFTYNKSGTIQTLSGANTYAGDTTITAGTIKQGVASAVPGGTSKGNVSVAGTFDLGGFNATINGLSGAGTVDNSAGASAYTLSVGNNDQTASFTGIIKNTSGTVAVTKAGTGTLTLSGVNTYTGATSVGSGKLNINSPGSITSATTVSGAGTLGGSGTAAAVTVNSGGTIAPGASAVGFMTNSSLALNTGSMVEWEMSSAAISEGVNQDLIVVNGAMTLSGTCTIVVKGAGTGFDNTSDQTGASGWRIATASGGITGFSAGNFSIDTTGFAPSLGTGAFRAVQSGNDLYLEFVHPPFISASTIAQSVSIGGTANMSVTATGTAPLSYQWNKNGNPIALATDSAYSIAGVTTSDAASYSVIVSNLYSTASASGVLAVRPVILTQPVAATNNPGDSVTFSVVADGGGTLGYQWKKNGNNIPGATLSALTFNPVKGTNAAEELGYTVLVSNNSDATVLSDPALLRVSPEFASPLPAKMAAASGDVNMNAYVTGTTNLFFQWYKNNVAITDDSKYTGTTSTNLTLSSVVDTDSGTYSIVATNIVGAATNSTVLTVSLYAAINDEPLSRTNVAGTTATFTVGGVGSAPLSYQWQKGGGNIDANLNPSAATSSLTLANVQTGDEDNYTVIVSNTVASVSYTATSSPPATLTVYYPVTASGPVDQTVVSNTAATFSTSVTSTHNGPTITYQWYKGAAMLSNGAKYTGTASTSLQVLNALTTDNGSYSVVVTGYAGSITNSAALTVIDPIVITSQPADKTVGLGTNATFTVGVIGTSPTYQWQRDGANLSSATTASYTLLGASHADETAQFTCIVSNFAGSVTSSVAHVIVQDVPVFTLNPINATTNAGGSTNFTVAASGQNLSYQWYSTNTGAAVLLTEGGTFSGVTSTSLTVSSVDLSNAIGYLAVASNIAGSATSTVATLTVNKAPTNNIQPSDLSVKGGDNAVFSISATGFPLTYQWSKNGVNIAGATASSYTAASVNASSFGYYQVVTSNSLGTVTSRSAVLSARYTNLWQVTSADGRNYITGGTGNAQRGLAYNPVTQHIIVADHTTALAPVIGVVNAATGAHIQNMDVTGINSGTFALNRICVADDGVIYGCNLNTANSFIVYRWANENATPTVSISGTSQDPLGTRWGDIMCVRGSGNNTQILIAGGSNDKNIELLTTTDGGVTFTGRALTESTLASEFYASLFFGTGNTFYSKSSAATPLKQWSFDPVTGATALLSSSPDFNSNLAGLVFSASGNLVYGLNFSTHRVNIYDFAGADANEKIADFAMGTANANSALSGIVVDGPAQTVVALEPNNGLLALTNQALPTVTSPPASVTNNAGTDATFSVGCDQAILYTQWKKNGVPIVGQNGASLTLSDIRASDAGTYSVVAVSGIGPVTSTDAVLTVIDPAINLQPHDVSAECGSTTNLTVTAAGTGTLHYQWYKGAATIGNNSSSLLFSPASVANSGNYNVVVTGDLGSITSAVVVVSVTDTVAPVITQNSPGDITLQCHLQSFVDPGATASDVCAGGSLTVTTTSPVNTNSPADYVVTYTADDGQGNTNTSTRVVHVVDGTPPTVHVTGSNPTRVVLHTSYNEVGATATDACDASVTAAVPSGGVNVDSAGSYTITYVASDVTGNSATNYRTVNVVDEIPATVTTSPTNQTIECHTDATLVSVADGSGTLSYQWYFATLSATNAVADATNASLTLTTVSAANEGSYTVVVTNLYGSATSGVAVITVTDTIAPLITIQGSNPLTIPLHSAYVEYGATATDACAGDVTTSIITNNSSVNVNVASTYTVTYTVSDSGNTTNVYRTVLVTDQSPVITGLSASQTNNAGTDLVLSVTNSGVTPFTYAWQKDGGALSDGGKILGSATSSLTVTNIWRTNAGTYSVIISNVSGSVTSDAIVVGVIDPAILVQPASVSLNKGQSNLFTVVAGGTTNLHFQWYTINNAPPFTKTVIAKQTNASYQLPAVTAAPTKGYFVVVSNVFGVVTSDVAQVTFWVPPTIGTQPKDVSVAVGANVSLSVKASGSAPLSYQWLSNSVVLVGETTNSLVRSNVQTSYTAQYQCVVTNGGGSVTSTGGHLSVTNIPVKITTQPGHFSKVAGNNVTFTIKATGTAPLSYQWKKNGGVIGGEVGTALALINVQDIGTSYYSCVVSNPAGPVESDTNSLLHGQLVVLADTNKPTVAISYPASGARLTNGQSYTFGSATAIAPIFHLAGTAGDGGLITNVTIQRTYPTTDAPVTATVYPTAPGKLTFTNQLSFEDGTNTYVVTVYDSAGNSNLAVRTFFYVNNTTMLHQTNNGSGTTIPVGSASTFTKYGTPTNGAILEIGRTYTIQAVPDANNIFTNWTDAGHVPLSSSNKLTFTMSSNLVIYANFATNPIVAAHVDGTYNGLFYETNGSGNPDIKLATAGSVTSVKVGTNGVFSGKLNLQGVGNTLSGTFDKDGNFSKAISRAAQGRSTLNVTLHLDWVGATKQITGTVDSAVLLADLASVTNEHPAFYTLSIPSADETGVTAPGGSSYATITNGPAGTIGLAGKTADGVSLSQKAAISKDGNMPLSIQLYGKLGLLEGWLHFTPTTVSGAVTWIKPATNNPATYIGGFTNDSIAYGTVYTNKTPALANTNLTLTLTDCDGLTTNKTGGQLSWNVWLNGGKLMVSTNLSNPTNIISGSVAASTGVLSVSYQTTAGGVKKTMAGVVDQGDNTGAGYLIGTNHVGGFSLTPVGP